MEVQENKLMLAPLCEREDCNIDIALHVHEQGADGEHLVRWVEEL